MDRIAGQGGQEQARVDSPERILLMALQTDSRRITLTADEGGMSVFLEGGPETIYLEHLPRLEAQLVRDWFRFAASIDIHMPAPIAGAGVLELGVHRLCLEASFFPGPGDEDIVVDFLPLL